MGVLSEEGQRARLPLMHRHADQISSLYPSKLRWAAIPLVLCMALFIWASDKVTLQGERTFYTVECQDGAWDAGSCSGRLSAGPRFRYRALRARGEVLFWEIGAIEPSSKFTDCAIQDGRNWTCPGNGDSPKSITLALSRGEPVRNPAWPTRPFHLTSKFMWWLLDSGTIVGSLINWESN
jgi:hypothetical protein